MATIFDAKRPPGGAGPTTHAVLAAPLEPAGKPRAVGPFAAVVHARIPEVAAGALPVDSDVRPHPHIGVTAISYVLEGSVTHRDSLGNRRELHAGDLGATVSGRGIVHSERTERLRLHGGTFEMFQLLLAHPDGHEDGEPSFFHRASAEHPVETRDGATVRSLFPLPPATPMGMPTATPILLVDVTLDVDARWTPPLAPERAFYVREGEVEIGNQRAGAGKVVLLDAGESPVLRATAATRLLAFGGTPVGPRYVWWNYIHSSLERVEAAKAEWRAGKVKLPPGDTESFTPAPPDNGRPLVHLNSE